MSLDSIPEYLSSSDETADDDGNLFDEDDEFWSLFSSVYINNNLTLNCLEDVAELINKNSGSNKIPTTKSAILRKFLQKSQFTIQTFILCSQCNVYSKSDSIKWKNAKCSQCNENISTNNSEYILYIGIKEQIRYVVKNNLEAILEFMSRNTSLDKIKDINDGAILKDMNDISSGVANLNVSVTMCTDGASLFKSTNKSLWPIYLCLNCLPPNIRFNLANTLLASLYIGASKPNMNRFLKPLIDEFQILEVNTIDIASSNKVYKLNVFLTHCCLDLPAKACYDSVYLR